MSLSPEPLRRRRAVEREQSLCDQPDQAPAALAFPAVAAFKADRSVAARTEQGSVLRGWLSGIRPSYRRHVRGRSTFVALERPTQNGRRRAS